MQMKHIILGTEDLCHRSLALLNGCLGKYFRGACAEHKERENKQKTELHLKAVSWACTLGRFLRYS